MERELIFVYNANTDPLSVLVDYAHKMFKPSSYKCELCALTHHNLGERSSWKKFRKRSGVSMEFMYIRAFEEKFNLQYNYPVILQKEENNVFLLMGKADLQKIESVEELITQLKTRLSQRV